MIDPQTPPRQTLSYLRNIFQARGIRPKNKLGQSFLIDLNLLDVILRTAGLTQDDMVLEIGAGTGSLTTRLAGEAGAVLSVEIDPDFFALAKEMTKALPNVTLLHVDILKNKNTLNPVVLATLANLQDRSGRVQLKLVANLPYAVAAPALANLLLSDFAFERMVVMVQSEIADRLLAAPGCKEYGALAVLLQSLADIEAVRRRVPPTVFWPRPQVESAIILIQPNVLKRAHVGDVARFRNFLRDLYTQRRKNLRSALTSFPNRRREKADVDRTLAEIGLPGTVRAEELTAEQHLQLCNALG
jgi:16S rRNA (adenine1518-N6/adenine1519-N6)-dimethyltransferase